MANEGKRQGNGKDAFKKTEEKETEITKEFKEQKKVNEKKKSRLDNEKEGEKQNATEKEYGRKRRETLQCTKLK